MKLSVVIPTLGREGVLLDTIRCLRGLESTPVELLVIDQTSQHEAETIRCLREWNEQGEIRWIKRTEPSIPAAMNEGLHDACNEIVLFLDDDILPDAGLLAAHISAHADEQASEDAAVLIAGQVLQPGEEIDTESGVDAEFSFRSSMPREIEEFMGGNFSVSRDKAIALGGFDENFTGAAYRFERDFADRWLEAGNTIRFEPLASLRHLRAERGGTRAYGSHLTTTRPEHSVGEYYYLLTSPRVVARGWKVLRRFVRAPMTRHHFCRPWYIPLTIIAEARGLVLATRLHRAGRKFLEGSC